MNKKAFTLIELMTVVGIIAILAGLMLVGYNIFFKEANIGSGMRFDSSIHHTLGYALVGDWKLDDNAANSTVADSSGNDNDGTFYINGVSANTSGYKVDGANGTALDFNEPDGDDYVTINSSNEIIDLSSNDGYSVSAWAKFESGTNAQYIVAAQDGGHDWSIRRDNTSGDWQYTWADSTETHILNSNETVTADEWYYLVAVNDEAGNSYFYVNGDQQTDAEVGNGTYDNTSFTSQIGAYSSTHSNAFNGALDQVRIYSAPLSTEIIKQNYYAGLEKLHEKGLLGSDDKKEVSSN